MRPSYTIGFSNVDQHHQFLVRAMIKRSSSFLSADWAVVDSRPVDVLLHGPTAPAETQFCRIVARLGSAGESGDGPYDLPDPLRLMSMLTILERAENAFLVRPAAGSAGAVTVHSAEKTQQNSAPAAPAVRPAMQPPPAHPVSAAPASTALAVPAVRPASQPAAPPSPRIAGTPPQRLPAVIHTSAPAPGAPAPGPAPAAARPEAVPGRSAMLILAETIFKAMASSKPGVIKAVVGKQGPMWIDLRHRIFAAPFQLAELPESGAGIEIELIAASEDAPSPVALPGTSLDKLLWHIGLRAAGSTPAPWISHPETKYRLKYWPNFAELPHSINHMNIAARFGSEALSAREVSEKCRIDVGVAVSSINAMTLMGLLREQVGPEIRHIRTVIKPEQVGRISGLIGRFRNKFGW